MANEEILNLANDVLDISRNRLLVNLRYMDVALSMHRRSVMMGPFRQTATAYILTRSTF